MRRANRGFTLLEVMIAVAIIATTVFALLYIRTRAVDHTALAREARRGWNLLQMKVGDYEEVKIDDVKEGTESGTFEDPRIDGARWERITEKLEMAMIEKVDEDHPREMWKITVRVYQMLPDGTEKMQQSQFYRLLKEDDAQEQPPGPPPEGG